MTVAWDTNNPSGVITILRNNILQYTTPATTFSTAPRTTITLGASAIAVTANQYIEVKASGGTFGAVNVVLYFS
jgi:hypothetical protein